MGAPMNVAAAAYLPGQGATVHEFPRRSSVSPADWPNPGPEDRGRIVQVRYTKHARPDPDVEIRRLAGHPIKGGCMGHVMASVNPVRAMAAIVRRLDEHPRGLSVGTSKHWPLGPAVFRMETDAATGRPASVRVAEIDQGLTLEEARTGLSLLQRTS